MTPAQLTSVLETAVRAPSVHNTQPWLFELRDGALHVRVDRTRQLTVLDPLGRELRLSCGAAVDHARLAVRGLGRACTVDWTAHEDDPEHVATLTISGPLPVTGDELSLLDAVLLRRSDRTAFTAEAVPTEVVAGLQAAAALDRAHLTAETVHARVLTLEGVVARADTALRQDPDVRRETAAWVRSGARPGDGLPSGALPQHGRDRGSSLALRDFAPVTDSAPSGGQPPVAEHPLLLLLSTDTDTPEDWARAGGALSRVLLTATAAGLVASPETQAMEVPGFRRRLVEELGLVGWPQMLLRAGFPSGPGSPSTGRRPVREVLLAAPPGRTPGPRASSA